MPYFIVLLVLDLYLISLWIVFVWTAVSAITFWLKAYLAYCLNSLAFSHRLPHAFNYPQGLPNIHPRSAMKSSGLMSVSSFAILLLFKSCSSLRIFFINLSFKFSSRIQVILRNASKRVNRLTSSRCIKDIGYPFL